MAGKDESWIKNYIKPYTGRTKLYRLRFFAYESGNLLALRMLYDEIKKGKETWLLKDVAKIGGRLGPNYEYDEAWVDDVEREAVLREEQLKNNLNASLTAYYQGGSSERTLNQERVWQGYCDLGDFYYEHGRLDEALNQYTSLMNYCTIANFLNVVFKAILVMIGMGRFDDAATYARLAEEYLGNLDIITSSKLRCVAGLAYLKNREYKLAAQKFLETSPEIGDSYSEVISPREIAVYGGLCALASFDHLQFKIRVINNKEFQKFLEWAPEMSGLIDIFRNCHYDIFLKNVEILKPDLFFDLHLHDNVDDLCAQMRKRALIRYTLPKVDLKQMAKAFRTSVTDLEKELEPLIDNGLIHARF